MNNTPLILNTYYHYSKIFNSELIFTNHVARSYPWHTHTRHWTVGCVCSGTAILRTRTETRTLVQGNLFTLPPNITHALNTSGDTILVVLCINNNKDSDVYANYLLNTLYEMESKKSFFDKYVYDNLFMMKHLVEEISQYVDFEHMENHFSPAVQRIVSIIQEHPDKPFPVGAMASFAGYSQWHFLRLFQKETGLTPHAYQVICRLGALRSLLRADTATVDAAVSAGFSDQSHMHKLFKLHHGLTPRQFKQASIISEL